MVIYSYTRKKSNKTRSPLPLQKKSNYDVNFTNNYTHVRCFIFDKLAPLRCMQLS